MPKVSDLSQSKYLAKEDVEPDILVTIASYEQVDVSRESDPTEMKWALKFKETSMDGLPLKPLVLNKTNGILIEAITGSDDFDDWIGKKVVLYNDRTIMFAGKLTGGIRVKADPTGEFSKPTPVPQTQPADDDDIGF